MSGVRVMGEMRYKKHEGRLIVGEGLELGVELE